MAFMRQTFTAFIAVGPLPDEAATENVLMLLAQAIVKRIQNDYEVFPLGIGITPTEGEICLTYESERIASTIVRMQNAMESELRDE